MKSLVATEISNDSQGKVPPLGTDGVKSPFADLWGNVQSPCGQRLGAMGFSWVDFQI